MESHRDLERIIFFCGYEFIKFVSVNFPTYVVKSLLNVSQDSFMAMVPLAFNTRLKKSYSNHHIASCPIRLHFPEGGRLHQ